VAAKQGLLEWCVPVASESAKESGRTAVAVIITGGQEPAQLIGPIQPNDGLKSRRAGVGAGHQDRPIESSSQFHLGLDPP
jgi:hypothetical protein